MIVGGIDNNLKMNKTSSFGARVTPEITVATKLLRDFNNKGYQSATGLSDIRYPDENFKNDLHRALVMLKISELDTLIELYRHVFENFLHFNSKRKWWAAQKKVIDEIKAANCGECANFAYFALLKKGIPSRIVYDETIDHAFVVANREAPVLKYKDNNRENFVVDFWMKKIYPSLQEAYVDYKRYFRATWDSFLQDTTDEPFYNRVPRKMTKQQNEAGNSQRLAQLSKSAQQVKFYASQLREAVLKDASIYQGKTIEYLKKVFSPILESSIPFE